MANFRRKQPSRRPPKPAHEEPPVLGQVEVVVERVGARGDGLALSHGARLYVPQSLPGDRMMVKFGQRRADGWEAVPVSLVGEAPGRAEPPCKHFGTCGGCVVQHMAPDTYAAWKLDTLRTILGRNGLLDGVTIHPMVTTPPEARRRAVMTAVRRGKRLWLGFNERASHRLVDVEHCPVLLPSLVAMAQALRPLLAQLLTQDGQQCDVALTQLDDGVEVVLEGLPEPKLPELEMLSAFAEAEDLARLAWRRKAGAPAEPIALRRTGLVTFGNVTVSPAPGAFLQASRQGEQALASLALAGIGEARSVADLFAGSGTLTFPLATKAKVHAVEGEETAVRTLEGGAKQLPVGQVTVERRDLFRDPLVPYDLNRFDAIVFDPPRAGAEAQAAEIARSTVPTVVAVSCNPTSFARDAQALLAGGFRLVEVTPVDQFLWSAHLELVGVFRR